tara:strand:+ start:3098 stop:4282 length:1185 start_codon:yes stop_codon:yes gene_type:complete
VSGLSLFGSGLTITEAQGPTYYLGTWNASTNTPTLASSTAPAGPGGSYYIVSVAGTTNLNGITDWTVGDWVIWSGSVWQKLEGGMTSVTVGSTLIAGGTTGRVLYDNAGVLGEMTNTGTGTVNVLQTSPALITPALGIATGTSLALGGATIGTNALAVTGTTALGGSLLMGAATSITVAAGGIVGVGFALDQQAAGDISTKAAGRIGFSPTSNPSTTPDTAFSRISAGIIGVGTGAAGNIAGGLQAATLALGGATLSGNALAVTGTAAISGKTLFAATVGINNADPGTTIGLRIVGPGASTTTHGIYLTDNGGNLSFDVYDNGTTLLGRASRPTTATTGFPYIPSGAGAPTGVPTVFTGMVPLYYDTTNKQFWIYDGAWLQPKTPAGAAIVTWQ